MLRLAAGTYLSRSLGRHLIRRSALASAHPGRGMSGDARAAARAAPDAGGGTVSAPAGSAPVRLRIYRSGGGGALARITLCREKVLNALDAEAVEAVRRHMLDCASGQHAGVAAVVLDSSTPRAFCAGGDVKSARAAVLAAPYEGVPPSGHHIHRVFQAEYSLVVLASELSAALPVVALCDGIWMGLGFGIAGFCRHRVVTEGTVFAMPENMIGLWPDVGFAWRAARLASPAVGLYLALTGARVASASDLLWLGIGTHYCASANLPRLLESLEASPAAADAAVARCCVPAAAAGGEGGAGGGALAPGPLRRQRALLERCFAPLLEEAAGGGGGQAAALLRLVARLEVELATCSGGGGSDGGGGEEAAALLRAALDALASTSPGSQAITLRHYAAAATAAAAAEAAPAPASASGLGAPPGGGGFGGGGARAPLAVLRAVMQEEYRIAVRRAAQPDFLEGVRALLVDKDRAPRWAPRDLGSVDASEAAGLAAPLPAGAAGLDLREVDAAVAAAAAAASM
ncbi:MAG: ClpP/crotonase-like domain-containing protein [Monoraphidium minutum]|nr:MAG: ClpP/crotonase-like domain-containing protein [Monoraphidium minutum]